MTSFHTDEFRRAKRVKVSTPSVHCSRRAIAAAALALVGWVLPLAPLGALALAGSAWLGIRRQDSRKQVKRGKRWIALACVLSVAGLFGQGYAVVNGQRFEASAFFGPQSAHAEMRTTETDRNEPNEQKDQPQP